jgi:hypothetical protein
VCPTGSPVQIFSALFQENRFVRPPGGSCLRSSARSPNVLRRSRRISLPAPRQTGAKRVAILGFSHNTPVHGVALPDIGEYETPFGPIPVDREASGLLLPGVATKRNLQGNGFAAALAQEAGLPAPGVSAGFWNSGGGRTLVCIPVVGHLIPAGTLPSLSRHQLTAPTLLNCSGSFQENVSLCFWKNARSQGAPRPGFCGA